MTQPNKAAFQAVVGDSFNIHFDNGEVVTLTLDELVSKEHLDNDEIENFALIFSGPDDKQLVQASFHLVHETLGTQFVFLVPVAQGDGRVDYEAAFSIKKQPNPT